jgi:hypothetical protein
MKTDMIPNPTSSTPLPRLDYTITSRNPDLRDHTTIAETAHQALHAKQHGYPEYPEVPRLVVLSREEAWEMGVPGFSVKVGGKVGEGSDFREGGVGAEDKTETEAESEDRVELEVGNAEIGKELAMVQVEQEDDVLSRSRSRSPETDVKPRFQEFEVKVKVETRRRRRRWWWDSTWVDGWTGKSTASSSGGGSDSGRETVEGGMKWEEEGVTVLPGTTVRITTTASLMILVPDGREITFFEECELIRADGCCGRCSSTLRTIRRSQDGGA